MPESQLSRDNIFATSTTNSTSTDDLGLLADTIQRLDAEIENDIKQGFAKREAAPSNLDLLQGAMKRIAQLESQLKDANKRAILAEANSRKFDAETDLELENDRLRCQVQEMEAFLADYGLIWVGNTEESDSDSGFSWKNFQKVSYFTFRLKFELFVVDESGIDWRKIVNNLHELNELAGIDRAQAQTGNKFGQLVHNSPHLKISLYSDGVLLGAGPFRKLRLKHLGTFDRLQTQYKDRLISVNYFYKIYWTDSFPASYKLGTQMG